MGKYTMDVRDSVSITSEKLVINTDIQAIQTLHKIANLDDVNADYYSLEDFSRDKWNNGNISIATDDTTLGKLMNEIDKRHLDYLHLICKYKEVYFRITIIVNEFPTKVTFVGDENNQEILQEFMQYIENNI